MFQTNMVEKIKTHFVFNKFCVLENHAAYEIIWQNIVELYRLQMTILRMCIALWATKATNIHL
jgi:hypothetical protein